MFSEHVRSRNAQRDATHRRVLATAEKLFRNQGFGRTTVRQIASEAGVSAGTVMAVGDKDGLLVLIFDGWIGEVHSNRRDDVSVGGELSPEAAVDSVVDLFDPFVTFFARDWSLSREYAAIVTRGTHTSTIFDDLASRLAAELVATLMRAGFAPADAQECAGVIYFAYLGILMTAGTPVTAGSERAQLRRTIHFVVTRTQRS